jgi:hypothetical protein
LEDKRVFAGILNQIGMDEGFCGSELTDEIIVINRIK